MKRRTFLQKSTLVAAGTLMAPSFLAQTIRPLKSAHKKLIVIQLSGGNDGLNTVVPFRNDLYYKARPKLALSAQRVLSLDQESGLHPSMSGLNNLYQKGFVSIIRGVGYPNPNRSHFRSMDIWHTGSGSDQNWDNGWLGRYLDAHCQHAYQGVELDGTLSLAMKGDRLKGIAMERPDLLYKSLQDTHFEKIASLPQSTMWKDDVLSEDNQGYLYKTLVQVEESATYLYQQSKRSEARTSFPEHHLGQSLKSISELIQSESDTSVYYASLSGFDTHVSQANTHSQLLQVYSQSVEALVTELERTGHFDDTLIMTFSEFGRRIAQNASNGTDHGAANNVFLIGKNLPKPGLRGKEPDLTLWETGDVPYDIDFRSIYADILQNWLEVNAEKILKNPIAPAGFI